MPEPASIMDGVAQVAVELRRLAGRDAAEAARRLAIWSGQLGVEATLQSEALMLSLDAHDSVDSATASAIAEEVNALLERVVTDYRRLGGDRAREERAQRDERLRDHMRRSAPPSRVVFRGLGLSKTYPNTDFKLGPVDLTLRAGEITGVVGQNAHGKTSLLRIVAGELRPDAGAFVGYPLFGAEQGVADWARVKSRIAYVPQDLQPWRGSLRDSLHYEAAIHGVTASENERAVAFVVERLDLGEHLDKRWSELSGGYRLRLALAKALVWQPMLLVMDEPLANLDVKAKSNLLKDLLNLAQAYRHPIAVLISSHDLHDLEYSCQQMVFLRKGDAVFVGPTFTAGDSLDSNEFMLTTPLTPAQLRLQLDTPQILDVHEEGVTIVRTDRSVDAQALLGMLLARGVAISYFRDISRSVRRLFS